MALAVTVEDFQIGRVVSRTFGALARNAAIFLPVAVLVMLPELALNLYLGSSSYLVVGRNSGWIFGALSLAVQLICPYIMQAALVRGTLTDLNGERPSLGKTLSTGFALFLPVLVITLMALLCMMLGFLLLVVPGLILITGWSVVIPVRVAEGTRITQSFSRSWGLTQEYRWKIFALVLMYWIVAVLLGWLVTVVAGVSLFHPETLVTLNRTNLIVLKWIESVVVYSIASVGATAIYYELRTVKEGVAPEQLAAAFD